MSSLTIGIIGLCVMLILMFLGMPIAFVFGVSGVVGMMAILGFDMGINYMMTIPVTAAASYTLLVMPMFMMMGDVASAGGLTTDAYTSARYWFGHKKGGLAITTSVSSAIFGAVCGSGVTTAMVFSQIAWPEMKKFGYSPRLGLAAIAAAGPLGTLIPPSVPLIMYGIMSETSIAKLFMAGWLPGILLLICLCITIVIWAKRRPQDAPLTEKYPLKERFKSLIHVWPFFLLIILVMGGIWGGICTVNEGAAVGAVGATIITFAMRRISVKDFIKSMKGVVGSGASFFFLFVGVQFFNSFMSLSGLPKALSKWVGSLDVAPMAVIWLMVVIYLFLGCFLDVAPLMMLTVPIFAPIVASLGMNLIWFGIIVTFCGAIGCVTPPVGMNLFVIANRVPDVKIGEIIKGIIPFIVAMFVALVLCMYIPQISLLLPNLMK